jgi:hypothetical protein
MTSNAISFNDGPRTKNAPANFLPSQQAAPNTFASSSARYNVASSDAGESSREGAQQSILATNGMTDGSADSRNSTSLEIDRSTKDTRSFRSHRTRTSGAFLLPSAPFVLPKDGGISSVAEAIPSDQSSPQEITGKGNQWSSEKRQSKRRSNLAAGVGSSLAKQGLNTTNVDGKALENSAVGNGAIARSSLMQRNPTTKSGTMGLDVDSAQIVNLALNLSESRRNASRRFVSTPLPHAPGTLGESIVGGSLRQHLQQQRRSSRNISPKPDRGDRNAGPSSRAVTAPNINSPLQSVFDSTEDSHYEYHFSASTLARAEKARTMIELMAQYRRLLLYVPPLKPQTIERTTSLSDARGTSISPASSTLRHSHSPSASATSLQQLGRPYNPLQYIRNRKVRSRTSRTIDGEAQGFGDLEKVSSWIDAVAQESTSEEYQKADCSMVPKFTKDADDGVSPYGSPSSSISKGQAAQIKMKRPRVDWLTNPADMLADIFWTEQDDNKKLVEDRSGRLIFPPNLELKRPISRRMDDEPQSRVSPMAKREEIALDLHVDTQLPEFKSVKLDSEKLSDRAASKAKQKLRNVTHLHHGHNGSVRERHHLRSKSRSDSDTSDSDMARPARRRRSGTADSYGQGKDILEKQMLEMLAKEAKQAQNQGYEHGIPMTSKEINNQQSESRKDLEKSKETSASHRRSGSLANQDNRESYANGSSGRASLEVPGINPRSSLDNVNARSRSSSRSRAAQIATSFVPILGRDHSPSRSRTSSPTRTPLARMGSKIRPLYRRNNDHNRHPELDDEDIFIFPTSKEQTPETPEAQERARSLSPVKLSIKTIDQTQKPINKANSIRKGKGDESGIRGLFKGPRNTVSKVSDYLWKKDASPGAGLNSGFSTDESDIEDIRKVKQAKKDSRQSSVGLSPDDFDRTSIINEMPSRLADMPSFTSPFERRGRPVQVKREEPLSRNLLTVQQRVDLDNSRASSHNNLQKAPRIDVHTASPNSSPDIQPFDPSKRDSSVSDIGSYHHGVQYADARLNSILGIPGARRNALPVTGLSKLETLGNRRPSMVEGHRPWSISDVGANEHRGPMTKRELARVRALLLSSGIKAKEISRRAAELKDLRDGTTSCYAEIASLTDADLELVPKNEEHRLAARILSDDIQISARICQDSADTFSNTTVATLLARIASIQSRLVDNLTPMTRTTADEADEVSKDLVTSQTLKVKIISDKMETMMRRRRRRFRWIRRGGWVMVEWVLVGVMWGVWFLVMLVRIVLGVMNGAVAGVRWLFWL